MRPYSPSNGRFWSNVESSCILLVLLVNLGISAGAFYVWKRSEHLRAHHVKDFSYIGDDYPYWFDIDVGTAEMTFEETVHFQAQGVLADDEWMSLRVPDAHLGYVVLGEERRLFAIAMYHELHCVNTFRKALVDPDGPDSTEHHVQHCLNYLRQFFLCSADTTLEPYDWTRRNYTLEPVGVTRQCRDWSAVYQSARCNFDDWIAFKNSNN